VANRVLSFDVKGAAVVAVALAAAADPVVVLAASVSTCQSNDGPSAFFPSDPSVNRCHLVR
jgi:hypothetical protein